jgi:LytS/YehU family sensor histidine kinase
MLVFAPIHGAYARLFPLVRDWDMHTSGFKGGTIAPEGFAAAAGFLIFSIPVVLFLEWVHKTRTITLLEKEKTSTELDLLKQQVNPHFFFNTLNNLYSLSLKQAPETPDTVLQLSELMRYVIYRAKEERVALHEEVKYLKDYLDLQRIRLYQDADIEFTVSMENPDLKIPPLLFIILVENAFKHGIEPSVGECFLELKLTEMDGEINFSCRNSLETKAAANVRSGGIGLQNLHRRLELLYPGEYDIQVNTQPDEYCVRLNIWGDALPLLEELRVEELVPNLNEQLL